MKFYFVAGAVITSGLCWYFANDLSGNYWYLLWVAPVPVLITSFRSSAKGTFVAAFIAYLVGRLSWLPYLLAVLPVSLAVFFTVLLPLIFALIVLLTRKIVLRVETDGLHLHCRSSGVCLNFFCSNFLPMVRQEVFLTRNQIFFLSCK